MRPSVVGAPGLPIGAGWQLQIRKNVELIVLLLAAYTIGSVDIFKESCMKHSISFSIS